MSDEDLLRAIKSGVSKAMSSPDVKIEFKKRKKKKK